MGICYAVPVKCVSSCKEKLDRRKYNMSGLDCESCGCKIHLEYRDKIVKLKSGKKIGFVDAPMLVCGGCGVRYIPFMTNSLITEICGYEKESEKKEMISAENIIVRECDESVEYKEEIEVWYDFNEIKNTVFQQKYIAEKVKFIYDKDDYFFIPGLIREWKFGFLTPVFFNIEVLLKYMHHPDYGLDIGADTFGYIYKGDEHYITFGINENNKVIMWLGDIGNLSVEEQFYLRSENIPSDHSIGSEFYEAEIEVKWAKASIEKALLKARLEFNESVRNSFGLSVAQLDTETLRIARNICKLIINTNDAFKDLMIPLNELLVEAINNNDIRKILKCQHPELKDEIKDKKGIKLLQLWLEKNTITIDVNLEIAPLFVLYDLRLVSAHLYSDESKDNLLKSCCTRLGLEENNRDYIVIANTLIDKLTKMYIKFKKALNIEKSEDNKENE